MRATAEKRTRRDIRRAMGPDALDLVGQQAKAIASLQHATTKQDFQLQSCSLHLHNLESHVLRVTRATLWGRLRWLLTGH